MDGAVDILLHECDVHSRPQKDEKAKYIFKNVRMVVQLCFQFNSWNLQIQLINQAFSLLLS